MIGVADGLYELNIGSSMLARQGGTDANTSESTRKAILRDWHVGNFGPQFWKILENGPKKYITQNEHGFLRVQDWPNERLIYFLANLKEFVNYRHPDPRRGEPRICSTQLDVFPLDPVESSRSARSAAAFREAHLEAPLSQFELKARSVIIIKLCHLSLKSREPIISHFQKGVFGGK